MNLKTIFILLTVLVAGMTSCKKKMSETTISRDLGAFDTLTINSVFDVSIIQDTFNHIEITGAAAIVDKVVLDLSNNTLTITNEFKGKWIHPGKDKLKLVLTVDTIVRINVNETCDVQTMGTLTGNEIGLVMTSKLNHAELNIDCESFYFWNNFPCGGKVVLSGTANQLKLWNVALMAIDASQLQCNYALVDNSSKGDCQVNVIQALSYRIAGEGNIYLNGNPPIIEKIEETSTGKLIKL